MIGSRMCYIPVAFAIAGLLDSIGIIVGTEAGFGKVTRQMLLRESSAIGEANVITVVLFARTGHCRQTISASKRVACNTEDIDMDSKHGPR
jgi:hypothetical protein